METKLVRHGEVILKAIDKIPKEAKLLDETNSYVVAHSETGHHHILATKEKTDMSKFRVYTLQGETYLEVPALSELLHEKTGKDAHKTHTITPNTYKIVIKKEFDYFAGLIRLVRD